MPWIEQQLTANGGAGSPSSQGRIVWAKAVFDAITNYNVTALAVNGAGSGYAVGDTIQINFGSPTFEVFPCVAEIVSVSPALIRVRSCGAFSQLPSPLTAIATTTLTGGGSGMTVDVTMTAPSWSDVDTGSPKVLTSYSDDITDFEWMCVSTRSPNPVYIGMKTWFQGAAHQVGLKTMTSFSTSATFEGQPGASPGDYTSPGTTGGYRMSMAATDPKLFMQWNERRLILIMSDAPRWQLGYMGLFIPYSDDPAATYPLPLFVAGTNVSANQTVTSSYAGGVQNDIRSGHASVCNPFSDGDSTANETVPYARRDNLSNSYLHYDGNGGSSQSEIDGFLWPAESDTTQYSLAPEVDGHSTDPSTEDTLTGPFTDHSNTGWFASTATSNAPGIAPVGIGNRSHFIVPVTLVQDQPSQVNVIGELEGLYKVHGIGLNEGDEIEAEDYTRWLVFPDINGGAAINRWCCVEIGTGGL